MKHSMKKCRNKFDNDLYSSEVQKPLLGKEKKRIDIDKNCESNIKSKKKFKKIDEQEVTKKVEKNKICVNQKKILNFFQSKKISNIKKTDSNFASKSDTNYHVCNFSKDFFPFFTQSNVKISKINQLSDEDLITEKKKFDDFFKSKSKENHDESIFFSCSHDLKKELRKSIEPKRLIETLNSYTSTENQISDEIKTLHFFKFISLYEKIKPPYFGTWCSNKHQKLFISNPFDTQITGLNYDFDSDIEWIHGDDGDDDDVLSNEEDKDDSHFSGDDELKDFIEVDTKKKSINSIKDVITNKINDESNAVFFKNFKCKILFNNINLPVNPFGNSINDIKNKQNDLKQKSILEVDHSEKNDTTINKLTPHKKTIKDSKILLQLISFIENNNDFSLNTIVDLCSKELHGYTKILLKNTIKDIASYDKKTFTWNLKSHIKDKLV